MSKLPDSNDDVKPLDEPVPGHDIFRDPALNETLANDPLFRFLSKYWQQIATVAVAVLAILYIRDQLTQTARNRVAEAADLYTRVRTEYVELASIENELRRLEESDAGEKKEDIAKKRQELTTSRAEIKARLDQKLRSLADARAPYGELASIYKLLTARSSGDPVAPEVPDWRGMQDHDKRLAAELQALAAARTLLDMSDRAAEGRSLLAALAKEGQFVHTAAGVSLATVSETPAERDEARQVLLTLLQQHPEQQQLVEPELEKLAPAEQGGRAESETK